MNALHACLLISWLWFIYKLLSFINNIWKARSAGISYTFSPLHELEIWAYITDPILRWKYATYLMEGQGWPKWARFMIKDWMYEDKGCAHKEFGEVFLVVAPGGIVCYVANAKTASDVCSRRKDFIKLPEKMKMLEPFGPNVVSTEGDLWRFHLRITLPPFGEAVNHLVWSESARQTELLKQSWATNGSNELKGDIYSLTVNVMACCGFGQRVNWSDDSNSVPIGHEISLVRSIRTIVMYLPHILLLPKWLLKRSPWKLAYRSLREFERYIHNYLADEKARLEQNKTGDETLAANLLTAVLKSNMSQKESQGHDIGGKTSLTDDEILGNVFMFLLAGYDTTANTIIFATIMLGLYDEVQNTLISEVDKVYQEAFLAGRKELSYTADLPKLRYVFAFMYEVMRIYPIVLPIGRMTTSKKELVIGNSKDTSAKQIATLPSHCGVVVNNTAIHFNDEYWPQPEKFDPRRWLSTKPNTFDPSCKHAGLSPDDTAGERYQFSNHMKGTFLTFSEGPRACLGRRFAQVEFAAFFTRLLKDHRIKLQEAHPGEVERKLRLCSGGSPVTLVPSVDVKIGLAAR